MNNRNFVPFFESLELKKLGFNLECYACYKVEDNEGEPIMVDDDDQYKSCGFRTCTNEEIPNHYVAAPLYQQAFKWFRDEHNLYPVINLHDREDTQTWRMTVCIIGSEELAYNQNVRKVPYYKTYGDAECACVQILIKLAKKYQHETKT